MLLLILRKGMFVLQIDGCLAGDAEIQKGSWSGTPMCTFPVFTSDLENTVGGKRRTAHDD